MLVICAIAGVVLYRSPYSASNLDITPDSIEYALGGHRLAYEAHYTIQVGGRELPPRYPPWFSLLVIAPAYRLLGPEPGNAIVPVTLFGVIGVLLAYRIGRRVHQTWGGVLAGLAVLALPFYRLIGREVLTDVPTVTLLLALCLVYLRMRAANASPERHLLFAGWLLAIAAMFRPVAATALVAFLPSTLRPFKAGLVTRRLAALVGPLAVAVAATLTYDASTFGSPWRSGYHFWCPVPFDYGLTFSISYVQSNLAILWGTRLPLVAAVALGLRLVQAGPNARRPDAFDPTAGAHLVTFLILGTGPALALHLLYFFPQARFFLPSLVLSMVVLGAYAGVWLDPRTARKGDRLPRGLVLAVLVGVLLSGLVLRLSAVDAAPDRRLAANRILHYTPPDAWVVSAIPPAYLEYFVARESTRRIVPISRRVEYASKLIAPVKVIRPLPPGLHWWDEQRPWLLEGGAQEAVPYVAAEQMEDLSDEVRKGKPVFVDATAVTVEDGDVMLEIETRFVLVPRAEQLFQLAPRL